MPDCKRRTNSAARIAGGGLYVDPPERCLPSYLAVGDRVHRTTAGQREIGQSRALLQIFEEVKERLLIHCLSRAGDVVVVVFELVARRSPWPQQMLQGG